MGIQTNEIPLHSTPLPTEDELEDRWLSEISYTSVENLSYRHPPRSVPTNSDDWHKLERYCKIYLVESSELVHKGLLDEYSQAVWFLRGLPKEAREDLMREGKVDIYEKPESFNIETLYLEAGEWIRKTKMSCAEGEMEVL
ncbi:MAG: hypothetical protein M1834_004631 [Cirrosporium novae-zelandiae]|nr:MAG: hypothetical protein M1834_004631 [Cirrosporium novae-zelandiae]